MRTIEKDVSRTDRAFGFYAVIQVMVIMNVQSLFHILMTYCVSHPNITYCQGLYLELFTFSFLKVLK